jgi:hypothetical protein
MENINININKKKKKKKKRKRKEKEKKKKKKSTRFHLSMIKKIYHRFYDFVRIDNKNIFKIFQY